MPRRRYRPADLTPVTRDTLPTYEHQDHPGRHRDETWIAWSTCGTWAYLRSEHPGTPWQLQHRPTGYVTNQLWSTLDDARHDTARPNIWRGLWLDALWVLDTYPEVTGGPAPFTPHDEARALLTWLVDEGHAPRVPVGTPA